jgi:hypothetical protein
VSGVGSLPLSGTRRRIAAAPVVCALLAALAGCSGHTTGASDIALQPDGTYSAKLNAIGSCDKGSPKTPCTAYTRWRELGTNAWTNGRSVKVPRKLSNVQRSQTATGLAPNTTYEYQACGKEFSEENVLCVGPRGTLDSERFTTGPGPQGGGQKANQAGTKQPPGETEQPAAPPGPQTAAPQPKSGPTPASSDTEAVSSLPSPFVPIAIGVAAGGLVLAGTWWASRRFRW